MKMNELINELTVTNNFNEIKSYIEEVAYEEKINKGDLMVSIICYYNNKYRNGGIK